MASPVLQALQNARMQEASPFGRWCITKNVRSLPASPAHVAAFIQDCAPLISIDEIWKAVAEISALHQANQFADPTANGIVAQTMNAIANIAPPRAWPNKEKLAFLALPYPLQKFFAHHDGRRDAEIRRAHNEAARARQELAAMKQPKEHDDHGTTIEDTSPSPHPGTGAGIA